MTTFPKNDFYSVNTKDIKNTTFPCHYEGCEFKLIINDDNGQRWMGNYKKGFKLDNHVHNGRYELFVISGKIKFGNLETKRETILEAGSYYVNPENVPHYEECLEDCCILWIYNKSFKV